MSDKFLLEDDIYKSDQYQELFMDNLGLQEEIEYLKAELDEYESSFNGIFDVENFKHWLRYDNLLSPELESFINYYIRYRNTKPRKEYL